MSKKNQIHKRIIISVTLIFSLLVFIVSLSFAWFLDNKHAFVSGIHVSTEYANNLQIKGQKDLWGYEDNVEFDSDLTLDPVISDGLSFFKPIYGYDTEGSGVHQRFGKAFHATICGSPLQKDCSPNRCTQQPGA